MPRESRRQTYRERQGEIARPLAVRSPALESAEQRRKAVRERQALGANSARARDKAGTVSESRRYAAESSAQGPAGTRQALPRLKKRELNATSSARAGLTQIGRAHV